MFMVHDSSQPQNKIFRDGYLDGTVTSKTFLETVRCPMLQTFYLYNWWYSDGFLNWS